MFETNDIIKDYIDELKCWISFEKTFMKLTLILFVQWKEKLKY